MCVLKNRETVFGLFFGFFFFSFPFPSLLGAQCQAGHGPCRLSSHCALRFQSSPRLIPGARRGISPRRSPGRCPPPFPAGAVQPSPSERDAGWGCRAGPREAAQASVPPCPKPVTWCLEKWKWRGGCAAHRQPAQGLRSRAASTVLSGEIRVIHRGDSSCSPKVCGGNKIKEEGGE